MKHRRPYPPREALVTRPSSASADPGPLDATALDRPLFVEAERSIPDTRTRPALVEPLPLGPAFPPPRVRQLGLWLGLAMVSLLGGTAGGAFGAWLAVGGWW